MTTNPVVEAELHDDTTVYYTDTAYTGEGVDTVSGKEFKIIPKEKIDEDAILDLLTVNECIYGFKTGTYWVFVAKQDVKLLKKYYRNERLPTQETNHPT